MPAHQQVVVSPRQARVEPPQQDPERQHLNAAQPRTFGSTNTPSPEIVVQNGATLITEGAHKAVTTPLPYLPIVALALGRVAEGLMYSVCFPYINKLISELGVRDEDVGKWSAAAVSLASVGDGCVVTPVVRAGADRHRKVRLSSPQRFPDPSLAISVIDLAVSPCIWRV